MKQTGGARIGMANASWPFATLVVTGEQLLLDASFIGKLVFNPDDIVSLEPMSGFISRGVKINHSVAKYKDHVVFWTFGSPTALIKRIEQTGFMNASTSASDD